MDSVQGRCNCGGLTITLCDSTEPYAISLCHCFGCRASGGSLFAVNLIVPSGDFKISGHSQSFYVESAASGNTVHRHFCSNCGSPTHTTVVEKPDITFVKGGCLRESGFSLATPFKEQWWRRTEAWETPYAAKHNVLD